MLSFESKMIEKLTMDADGVYIDSEGVGHESVADFLCNTLKFCGCGSPEKVLVYVCDSMQLIDDLEKRVWTETETTKSWAARCDAHFHGVGAMDFMWYYLATMNLTEHGSAVPGWLTDKGKEMLRDMKSVIEHLEA